ncbi:MAG TPA: redoxin family protein [Cyclobacteriaceae bacterium]|nr:redoxin family protein [Cyclobacteriaceae bacterium]
MKAFIVILLLAVSQIQQQPLIDVVTGQSVALSDFKGAKNIVVIFTSNVCAYDGYYSDRLKSLITTYRNTVQFVFVNSYQEAEETADKMKAKYNFDGVPYLADKDQVWMKSFGARKSPEVFVLDPGMKVIYSGAIDDNPQLANAVKENYLKKVLDGGAVAATRAVGCSIRAK